MAIKDELLFDFSIHLPRVLLKKLVLLSSEQIIVYHGQRFTSVRGKGLKIKELKDERMLITGDLEQLQFYGTLQEDKN